MPFLSRSIANPAPPESVTSPDGVVTATWYAAGVLLKADLSGLVQDPNNPLLKVRFTRNPDQLVRSGNDAWAPGGVAFAFDMEAPQGVTSVWTVQPVFADGTVGDASQGAVITSTELDDDSWCWVKSINDPALSLQLEMQAPDPETDQDGRDTLTAVQGLDVWAGGWDVPVQPDQTFTFKTYTLEQFQQLGALLSSGPLLVQTRSLFGIPDFYALRQSVHVAYQVGAYDPRRIVTATFRPIGRPPTVDAPLIIPGRSYDDLATYAGSYDQIDNMYPTYDDMLTPPWGGATFMMPFTLPVLVA